jgi:carbon monoxide dehydrogenase subunit G
MATIHKEIDVDAPPEQVWAAIRDIGAVHSRLAQRFVVDTRLERDSRLVTFANGMVVRERIVDIDDRRRRLAYSVTEWETTHHNASLQVFPDGEGRSRIHWIADLLPNRLADLVDGFMQEGSAAIQRTLEAAAAPRQETTQP